VQGRKADRPGPPADAALYVTGVTAGPDLLIYPAPTSRRTGDPSRVKLARDEQRLSSRPSKRDHLA
jgi:hypothetical protein